MSEGVFTYRAENGNVCEIVDTFAETFTVMETFPANPLFFLLHVVWQCRYMYMDLNEVRPCLRA
jgi:hypothetical protein